MGKIKRDFFQSLNLKNKYIWYGGMWSCVALLYVLLFSYPQWETTDDFLISSILSGIYGTKSPYTLVMSYPFGLCIAKLQDIFPYFNWLTIIEILCVVLSFWVFLSIIYKEKDRCRCAIATGAFVLLEISFLQKIHYTRSACLIIFAGGILLCKAFSEKGKKKWAILGSLFVLLGLLIRSACLYLSMPFACVYFLKDFLQERHLEHPIKFFLKKNLPLITIFIVLFITQNLLGKYNAYVYQKDASLASYVEFNRVRSKVADYLPDKYDEKRDEFEKIAFSVNDFFMLKNSIYYDEIFSQELFEKIDSSSPNEKKTIVQQVKQTNWIKKLGCYSQGRRNGRMNLFFAFMIAFVVSVTLAQKKSVLYIVAYFGVASALAVYFVLSGRFPPWIQDSLYMIGIFCMTNESRNNLIWKCKVKTRQNYMIMICSILVVALGQYNQEVAIRPNSYIDLNVYRYMDYMRENEDNIYLIDNFANCPFPIIDAYGTIKCMEPESWSNIIRVGSWYINHPVLKQQLQKCNIQSPIYSLLKENTFLLANVDSPNIKVYQQFFREHYGKEVKAVVVEKWGDYAMYSFEQCDKE